MQSLFVFVLFIYIADCKTFRPDYKYHSVTNGWLKLHQIPVKFHDAWLRCRMEGSVLASPSNKLIESAMRKEMTNRAVSTIFTGIHATFSKGDFFTIDGIPLNSMQLQWMPNEPDNKNYDEDCILYNVNKTIADIGCSETHPYICYKKDSLDLQVTECGTVDKEYNLDARTGKCYKFHKIALNWTQAFMTCSAERGHLAIINSVTEANVLKELFAKYPTESLKSYRTDKEVVHIGFYNWNKMWLWTTIHGTSLVEAGYELWAENQPDTATAECGAMFRNGQLDNIMCSSSASFICEKSPESLQTNEDIFDSLTNESYQTTY